MEGLIFSARDLGFSLKAIRTSRGMTQTQAGKRIGVGKTAISNYEVGRRVPSIAVLSKMAQLYSVALDELVW